MVSLHTCSKTLPESLEQTLNAFICPHPFSCNSMLAGIKHLARLEQVLGAREVAAAGWFDGLRKDYPIRREFLNTKVIVPDGENGLAGKLRGIGFDVS